MMNARREKLRVAATTLLFVLVSSFAISISTAMADSDETSSTTHSIASSTAYSRPAVHIVYTETPPGEDPKDFHIRTLASALGSDEAAKEALVYSYKTAASGFSAKLTPDQNNQAFYRLFQTARSGCTVRGFRNLPPRHDEDGMLMSESRLL